MCLPKHLARASAIRINVVISGERGELATTAECPGEAKTLHHIAENSTYNTSYAVKTDKESKLIRDYFFVLIAQCCTHLNELISLHIICFHGRRFDMSLQEKQIMIATFDLDAAVLVSWNGAIVNVISCTCAFPVMTSDNVCH